MPPQLILFPEEECADFFFPSTSKTDWCGEWQPKEQEQVLIDRTDLSVRTFKILWNHHIKTLQHLADYTSDEILALRNVGKITLNELRMYLEVRGLKFRSE